MKKLLDVISEYVALAFRALELDEQYAQVVWSARPDLCEFQCNGSGRSWAVPSFLSATITQPTGSAAPSEKLPPLTFLNRKRMYFASSASLPLNFPESVLNSVAFSIS